MSQVSNARPLAPIIDSATPPLRRSKSLSQLPKLSDAWENSAEARVLSGVSHQANAELRALTTQAKKLQWAKNAWDAGLLTGLVASLGTLALGLVASATLLPCVVIMGVAGLVVSTQLHDKLRAKQIEIAHTRGQAAVVDRIALARRPLSFLDALAPRRPRA